MSKIGHNSDNADDEAEIAIDWSDYDGFIVEARSSRNHPLIGYGKQVKPADEARRFCYSINEAWRDMLHECRYQDGYVMNGGKRMLLERGALIGAISYLAYRWNWTPKTVRGFLDRLEADGMIELRQPGISPGCTQDLNGHQEGRQKGKQAQVITLCNYDKFNTPPPVQGHANGHAEGTQRARRGHAEGMNHNKGTKIQEDSPLPPDGGAPAPEIAAVTPAMALAAFEAWNALALRLALPQAVKLTPDRRRRIMARLREYGLEGWQRALDNVGKSKFLTGETDKGFRADLEFLLQAKSFSKVHDGGFGCDRVAATSPQPTRPWWTDPEKVQQITPEQWRGSIRKHANGIWPLDKLGPAPGASGCLVPRDIVREMELEKIYDENGMKRRGVPEPSWRLRGEHEH